MRAYTVTMYLDENTAGIEALVEGLGGDMQSVALEGDCLRIVFVSEIDDLYIHLHNALIRGQIISYSLQLA